MEYYQFGNYQGIEYYIYLKKMTYITFPTWEYQFLL